MSKLDWLSFVSVQRILLSNKCIIFGGAVRDAIFHKFKATEFYDEREEYLKYHPNDNFDYNDKKISVNTLGRFTIPSDIDVFVYEDNYTNIISKLQEKYAVKIRIAKDLKYKGIQFNFVVSTNKAAVNLWQSLGFKIIGIIPNGFDHKILGFVDAYIMFKELS